jgi:heptosyltransferase III
MMKIIISRTDNLGDVVLSLPVAGAIKSQVPDSQVFFIGKSYTKPVIESCAFIDTFLDKDELLKDSSILANIKADAIVHIFPDKEIAFLAKKVKIPTRIGTSHRIFHWFSCNKLVNLSRKNSNLHESQLNIKLLQPLFLNTDYQLDEIKKLYRMKAQSPLPLEFRNLIQPHKQNVILHPKSKGSAREWKLENYEALIRSCPNDQFEFFITGTKAEGEQIHHLCPTLFLFKNVQDLTGKLTLYQLISFISEIDSLVACSTGPLHIASALGKRAIGIFPPIRPMHPQRWQPVGEQARVLCVDKTCNDCRKSMQCACIQSITALQVKDCLIK